MSDANWKKHFLGSGAPLEFETARTFAEAGFSVQSDYEYLRHDGTSEREFSVDIAATFYAGTSFNKVDYLIEMLIECKYRSREKMILFFPDPNIGEFADGSAGMAVSFIDTFAKYHLNSESIYEFEGTMPLAYKGVEVFDKGAYEKDFRHATQQLRFAAPELFRSAVEGMIEEGANHCWPRFLVRVLVSNAPIRILNSDASIKSVEDATSVEEISREVPAVVLKTGSGPEFTTHCQRVLSAISHEELRITLDSMEYELEDMGKRFSYNHDRPSEFVRRLSQPGYIVYRHCSHIVVVNKASLPEFITGLKDACRKSYRNRRKSDGFRVRRRR